MKNLKLFSILCLFVAVAIIGCKKGDTGPKGATGPAGPADVYHSTWISLNTPLNTTDSLYEQAITASSLTSAILDSGVVLAYIGVPTSGTDTAVFNLSDASLLVGAISQANYTGEIDIYAGVDYTDYLYRYVLIPGSIVVNGIGGKVYTKAQLKAMTYSEAQKTFGLSSTSSTTN